MSASINETCCCGAHLIVDGLTSPADLRIIGEQWRAQHRHEQRANPDDGPLIDLAPAHIERADPRRDDDATTGRFITPKEKP